MKRRQAGFTLIEVLVVLTILATLAGMVVVIIGPSERKRIQLECTNNVSGLVRMIEAGSGSRYPDAAGPDFVLYLVRKGEIAGPDNLKVLFCPGDHEESFDLAGGEAAYADLVLGTGDHDHLTSYAGRDQADRMCRASRGSPRAQVLIADDSEDHHFNLGIVVGLTGGSARFRDRMDDYELAKTQPLEVGPASVVDELKCLKAE